MKFKIQFMILLALVRNSTKFNIKIIKQRYPDQNLMGKDQVVSVWQ